MDANATALFPVPAIEAVRRELADIEAKMAELARLKERHATLSMWLQLTQQVFHDPAGDLLGVQAPAQPATSTAVSAAPISAMSPVIIPTNPLQPKNMKDRIVQAAEQVYRAEGPMRSRALLERIEALGVEVRGIDKAGTIATILSKSPRFRNDRAAGGWVLVEESASPKSDGRVEPAVGVQPGLEGT